MPEIRGYGQQDTMGTDTGQARTDFFNQKAAMFINGSWMLADLKTYETTLRTEMVPFPNPAGGPNLIPINIDTAFSIGSHLPEAETRGLYNSWISLPPRRSPRYPGRISTRFTNRKAHERAFTLQDLCICVLGRRNDACFYSRLLCLCIQLQEQQRNNHQLFRVVLPQLGPMTATVMITSGLWFWNDFMLPLLMLNRSERNWTLVLFQYNFRTKFSMDYSMIFTTLFISMIPILLLYVFFRKNIIGGLSGGAVKE